MAKVESAHVPVTVVVDLEAILAASMPTDWDADEGEAVYGAPLIRELIRAAAQELARESKDAVAQEAVDAARAQVADEVAQIVRETLDAGATVGNGYSATVVKPLRELIHDEVQTWLTGYKSDGWGGKKNPLTELVRKEVDTAVSRIMRAEIDAAAAKVREAVRQAAAEQIAKAAVR